MSKKTESAEKKFEPGQEVWITNDVLTKGIRSATIFDLSNFESLWEVEIDGVKSRDFIWSKQIHSTIEAAQAFAREQRNKRIKSLRKQIEKLEQLKFE